MGRIGKELSSTRAGCAAQTLFSIECTFIAKRVECRCASFPRHHWNMELRKFVTVCELQDGMRVRGNSWSGMVILNEAGEAYVLEEARNDTL